MPHVILKMAAGRTEAQKQALAKNLTKAVMETLGLDEDSVSVAIEDVPMADWAESVYVPDIQGRPETIYKAPGYNPFR
ncbi:4-oxalocrotonate tautomerase family protein [Rhizobium sp. WW_1]|jgi:4-oxalocrotonate tautomerase|uniref:tautomerase family protein n=1 Tax=unclassified Rhizobium TaxID=2613769 RepID=UPI000645F48B|nr:4-oxalocrotonate tautomerase family protein [Rhizobium tropici]OJY76530.1 MAG: 4-oxalocrotonate tautomerase [Rhizobium sp. 60-20]RKD52682.1 4-oxalocrotonate tautomerase [Rhizobium sp. WW_1]